MSASHPINNSDRNELETIDRCPGTDNAIRAEQNRREVFDFYVLRSEVRRHRGYLPPLHRYIPMVTIRPMSNGKGYSADYLESFDYYSGRSTRRHPASGVWFGKGSGNVLASSAKSKWPGTFRRRPCRSRHHPANRAISCVPASAPTAFAADGTTSMNGERELYDITLSAPKVHFDHGIHRRRQTADRSS